MRRPLPRCRPRPRWRSRPPSRRGSRWSRLCATTGSPSTPMANGSRREPPLVNRIFGVTGWKNAGKTTLTERLVAEFVSRGWRVATVKHAHHAADIDRPNTDSFRHRAAGATEVALVTEGRYAIMREQPEPTLAE